VLPDGAFLEEPVWQAMEVTIELATQIQGHKHVQVEAEKAPQSLEQLTGPQKDGRQTCKQKKQKDTPADRNVLVHDCLINDRLAENHLHIPQRRGDHDPKDNKEDFVPVWEKELQESDKGPNRMLEGRELGLRHWRPPFDTESGGR